MTDLNTVLLAVLLVIQMIALIGVVTSTHSKLVKPWLILSFICSTLILIVVSLEPLTRQV